MKKYCLFLLLFVSFFQFQKIARSQEVKAESTLGTTSLSGESIQRIIDFTINQSTNNNKLALKYGEIGLRLSVELNDTIILIDAMYALGYANYFGLDVNKSMDLFLKGSKLGVKVNTLTVCKCAYMLGAIYQYGSSPTIEAKKWTSTALDCYKLNNDSNGISESYAMIAYLEALIGNGGEAIANLLMSSNYASTSTSALENRYSTVYLEVDSFAKAKYYARRGIEIAASENDNNYSIEGYHNLADVFYETRNYDSAQVYYSKALYYANVIHQAYDINELNGKLAKVYASLGRYEEAYDCYEIYFGSYDSLRGYSDANLVQAQYERNEISFNRKREQLVFQAKQEN